jgi:5-formyltetrahydrofolate cyclo-ligase
MTDMHTGDLRRHVRRQMRLRRRGITAAQRAQWSRDITRHIARAGLVKPQRRIALFASMADEPDTTALLQLASQRHALVFLPRINSARAGSMSFAPCGARWRRNRFGIAEPAGTARVAVAFMHLIFLPLLAFDERGTRLGMGGGYYDRALAYRLRRQHWRGPTLIGIAYDMQEAPSLIALPHDVRLDAVVTPRGIRWF